MGERTHDLKVWPPFFDAVVSGVKPFEVRRDDRAFEAGDMLLLREWCPAADADFDHGYTGRQTTRRISYILHGGAFGVEPGFVVLGLGASS